MLGLSGVAGTAGWSGWPGCSGVVADDSAAREVLSWPEALAPSMMHYARGERVGHGKGAKPYVARVFCHTDTREEADALTARIFRAFSVRGKAGEELVCRESLPFMEEWGA